MLVPFPLPGNALTQPTYKKNLKTLPLPLAASGGLTLNAYHFILEAFLTPHLLLKSAAAKPDLRSPL